MNDDLKEKITGFGEVQVDNVIYQKIYYKLIVEKENPNDNEPDIYGTLKDKRGDKLDIAGFVGSSKEIFQEYHGQISGNTTSKIRPRRFAAL
jgi:hypothetical protein